MLLLLFLHLTSARLPVPERALPTCKNCSTCGYDIVPIAEGVWAFTDGGYWALAIENRVQEAQPYFGGAAPPIINSPYNFKHVRGEGGEDCVLDQAQEKVEGGEKVKEGALVESERVKEGTLTIVDAWQGDGFLKAVQDILKWTGNTDVKYLVYSHAHTDHIGGAGILKTAYPHLKIIAHEKVKEVLEFTDNSIRPLPDHTFKESWRIPEAGLELKYSGPAHSQGDIFIWHKDSKTLMYVDVVFPRWIPFWNMAISQDIPAFYRIHEVILAYDFTTFVGGHLTRLGDRADVIEFYDYIKDLKATAQTIGKTLDFMKTGMALGTWDSKSAAYGNLWDTFDAMLNDGAQQCADQLIPRWKDRLGGVDVWTKAQCWALIEALRVDF